MTVWGKRVVGRGNRECNIFKQNEHGIFEDKREEGMGREHRGRWEWKDRWVLTDHRGPCWPWGLGIMFSPIRTHCTGAARPPSSLAGSLLLHGGWAVEEGYMQIRETS